MDLAQGRRFWRPRRLRAPVGWPAAWVTWTWSCVRRAEALDPDEAAIGRSKRATNFISAVCRLSWVRPISSKSVRFDPSKTRNSKFKRRRLQMVRNKATYASVATNRKLVSLNGEK